MKKTTCLLFLSILFSTLNAQEPEETEDWSIKPPVVSPGKGTLPPSDAIVLYENSSDTAKWEGDDGSPVPWLAEDILTVMPKTKGIQTKQSFGDIQLHIEWRSPQR